MRHVCVCILSSGALLVVSVLGEKKKVSCCLERETVIFHYFLLGIPYLCVCWQQKTMNVSFGNLWQKYLFSFQATDPWTGMRSWSLWLSIN